MEHDVGSSYDTGEDGGVGCDRVVRKREDDDLYLGDPGRRSVRRPVGHREGRWGVNPPAAVQQDAIAGRREPQSQPDAGAPRPDDSDDRRAAVHLVPVGGLRRAQRQEIRR